MRVLFWPGCGGGIRHYRCDAPGAALARLGWDVDYVEDDDADFRADVVVLQRVIAPGIPDLIRSLRAHGITVVYDVDDDYDAVPPWNPYRPAAGDLDLIHDSMRAADLITVSTPALAAVYGRYGPVRVLPNYLDPLLWADAPVHRSGDTVTIGWLGEASARSADLALLKPWLKHYLQERPHVRFGLIGSPPEALRDLGVSGFVSPPQANGSYLRPYHELPLLLPVLDIGLAPLAFGRFNRSKSACKAMELGAAGVPVLASPSPEYRRYVQPGVNGQLARGDWPCRLDRIIDDLQGYQQRARQVAETYFIEDHIGQWVDAYTRKG